MRRNVSRKHTLTGLHGYTFIDGIKVTNYIKLHSPL